MIREETEEQRIQRQRANLKLLAVVFAVVVVVFIVTARLVLEFRAGGAAAVITLVVLGLISALLYKIRK